MGTEWQAGPDHFVPEHQGRWRTCDQPGIDHRQGVTYILCPHRFNARGPIDVAFDEHDACGRYCDPMDCDSRETCEACPRRLHRADMLEVDGPRDTTLWYCPDCAPGYAARKDQERYEQRRPR